MSAPKKVILVNDDDTINLKLLSHFLTSANYTVIATSMGIQALTVFQNQKIDLVITDIFLPDLDGVDLLNSLKAIDPNVKVITMTAHLPTGFIDPCDFAKTHGAYKALHKPIEVQQLKQIVSELFAETA